MLEGFIQAFIPLFGTITPSLPLSDPANGRFKGPSKKQIPSRMTLEEAEKWLGYA